MSIVTRKSPREVDLMRRAGRIVAEVLALVESELVHLHADAFVHLMDL